MDGACRRLMHSDHCDRNPSVMKTKEKGASALKRALIGCVLLLCLCASACAEIACDCQAKNCKCFIQLGDRGNAVKAIIKLLEEQGYLESTEKTVFSLDVYDAVRAFQSIHGLQETGMMDDDTLTMLIWGMDGVPKDAELAVVYVPTDGGIRYHNDSGCRDMYDPRKITICNAEALSISYCRICAQPLVE